jgi:hypothetical protein
MQFPGDAVQIGMRTHVRQPAGNLFAKSCHGTMKRG